MTDKTPTAIVNSEVPITEADLHGYADGQLSAARGAEVEAFLATHPQARERVATWREQNRLLRGLLDPVLDEPLPLRLPLQAVHRAWPWRSLAAGIAIAVISGGGSWLLRGATEAHAVRAALSEHVVIEQAEAGFAHRAVVAHAVYAPELRRPVELGGDQEQALSTWLTKRLGATVTPPKLGALGYELVGGRLLPGGEGPVAQFMYAAADGQRLTLYVTREVAGEKTTAFRFAQDGPVKVFYWVDERFGYALSGAIDRNALLQVSQEIYKQLD